MIIKQPGRRRAVAAAVAAAMVAAACLLALSTGATPARAGGITGSRGPLFGEYGDCLDAQNANSTDGTPVQIYPCNLTSAQWWEVEPGPFGDTIHATSLGKCLDVSNAGTGDGTHVQIWDCNGTVAQTWVPLPSGALVNPHSGRCLDVPSGAAQTQLQIYDCNPGSSHQTWEMPGQQQLTAGPVLDYSNGKCLDDRAGGTAPGNPVQIYTCTGGSNLNQQWTVTPPDTTGDYIGPTGDRISPKGLGNFCLAAPYSGSGEPVELYPCGTTADFWVPLPNGELVDAASGLCLDDPGGSTTDGTELQLYTCNPGSANQTWSTPILSGTP